MNTFFYNDTQFLIEKCDDSWNLSRVLSDGSFAAVGAGLFKGLLLDEAQLRSQELVKAIYPVGIKVIGPDVAHPGRVGDLRIIGPNVSHPNFIYWNKDSSSLVR
jgi:hypothetical protein